jgi:hypothetical protein
MRCPPTAPPGTTPSKAQPGTWCCCPCCAAAPWWWPTRWAGGRASRGRSCGMPLGGRHGSARTCAAGQLLLAALHCCWPAHPPNPAGPTFGQQTHSVPCRCRWPCSSWLRCGTASGRNASGRRSWRCICSMLGLLWRRCWRHRCAGRRGCCYCSVWGQLWPLLACPHLQRIAGWAYKRWESGLAGFGYPWQVRAGSCGRSCLPLSEQAGWRLQGRAWALLSNHLQALCGSAQHH